MSEQCYFLSSVTLSSFLRCSISPLAALHKQDTDKEAVK